VYVILAFFKPHYPAQTMNLDGVFSGEAAFQKLFGEWILQL
jgi:hypothetical protein